MAAASLLVAVIVVVSNLGTPSASSPASASPELSPSATTLVAESLDDLPTTIRPYPYTEPAPTPVPTEIDGTYMLILTLEDLGGPNAALPFPCRRCLPYARDPGVMTLIFFQGAYFVDHQMSGFHATGHYEVDGEQPHPVQRPQLLPRPRDLHVAVGWTIASPASRRRPVRVPGGTRDRSRVRRLDEDPGLQA